MPSSPLGSSARSSGGAARSRSSSRPKDRRAQIATAAALAFNERGYHSVGIDDIAATIGISGPALYRHFPSKYALLVEATMGILSAVDTAIDTIEEQFAEAPPAERLDALMVALLNVTIDHRRTGGLFRWESRYLESADRRKVAVTFDRVATAIAAPLRELRPELTEADARLIATATFSTTSSPTAHRAPLSAKRIRQVIMCAARGVLRTTLHTALDDRFDDTEQPSSGLAMTSKREVLLRESLKLFRERGFHDVSIEDISRAAGINSSSVYRHFASKADLLLAAFSRAEDRLAVATASVLETSNSPADALTALCVAYVQLSFAQPALMTVYFSDLTNLPQSDQVSLRTAQRLHVDEWASLVTQARPEVALVDARFLVHAAFGIVVDVGRLTGYDTSPAARQDVVEFMRVVLLGPTA